MHKPKQGNPFAYTQEKHDALVAAIGKNLPYEVAAWHARVCERTFYNWMTRGKEDIQAGKNTEFAQLVQDVLNVESLKITQHLDSIENGHVAWRGRLAILERRWRKFFGADAGIIQELLELITKLKQDINQLKANQGKVTSDG